MMLCMTDKKNLTKYYHLRVFGCQMNKSDAERVRAVMEGMGFEATDEEEKADVIIAVACSVRQSAVDRIYGLSGRWRKLHAKKILTGCVLEFDSGKLASLFDYIIPITAIKKLKKLVRESSPAPQRMLQGGKICYGAGQETRTNTNELCDYLRVEPKHQSKFQAYVPIMTGCDNYCSYCVVPEVRGREIFRPKKEIVKEVENLIKKGYKEITLLGENVNAYPDFPALLKILADIPGKFWIRFITSHPEDFTDELIGVIKDEKKICNYIHLPIQAGSTAILKKMNRKYTKDEYVRLVGRIRKAIPDTALSTDIIVGFPGETKKQFCETVDVMRKLKFDMAYVAQYSVRPGTAAARLEDDVAREEKKRREKVLMGILEETAGENSRRLVGRVMTVLVEDEVNRVNKLVNNFLVGKTEGFKNVRFCGDGDLVGTFQKVKILKVGRFGFEGELINSL